MDKAVAEEDAKSALSLAKQARAELLNILAVT